MSPRSLISHVVVMIPMLARLKMIARLDRFRDMLEDLGGGLGVTDPKSGEVVLEV